MTQQKEQVDHRKDTDEPSHAEGHLIAKARLICARKVRGHSAVENAAQRRAEIIGELQSRIMDEYNAARVGTVMEVLCEGEEPETGRCFGRTYADSPDIDGRVLFSAARSVSPGEFVMVRITGAEDGDLVGEMEENA